jgi:hypothetical protein
MLKKKKKNSLNWDGEIIFNPRKLYLFWIFWKPMHYLPFGPIYSVFTLSSVLNIESNTNSSELLYEWFTPCLFFDMIFFFLHVHTRERWEIRTNDLRFIRRGSQPIELPLEDFFDMIYSLFWKQNKYQIQFYQWILTAICPFISVWKFWKWNKK